MFMKKFYSLYTLSMPKIKRNILGWLASSKYRLVLFFSIFFGLRLLTNAPYFNLFLGEPMVLFIMLVLTPLILKLKPSIFVLIGFALFIPTMVVWLFGKFEMSEWIAIYIYGLFLTGVLKGIVDLTE